MRVTLAIDPGLRGSGVSVFSADSLVRAAYVKSPNQADRGPYAWRDMAEAIRLWLSMQEYEYGAPNALVMELQQVYATRFQKGNQDDLLQLAGVNGAISYAFRGIPEVFSYLPRVWKGTVKKEVMTARIESKLSPEELAGIEPCAVSLRHNVIDAVGLGLYKFGRLGRG